MTIKTKKSRKASKRINRKRSANKNKIQSQPNLAKLLNIRLLRFLVVGIINTGFSYSIYALLLYCGLDYRLANLGALITGILFSFKTQGKFVFKNTNNKLFLRFLVCWIIIYSFNILIIGYLNSFAFNNYASGALALIPVTIFSFVLQKYIVFKARPLLTPNAIAANSNLSPK